MSSQRRIRLPRHHRRYRQVPNRSRRAPDSGTDHRGGAKHSADHPLKTLLARIRAVEDRLKRRLRPGSTELVGLIPSRAHNGKLKQRAEERLAAFRQSTVERELANHALHAGTVPQPLAGGELTREHTVHLGLPDRPTARVGASVPLTFEDSREVLSVARAARRELAVLVDGLIEAFRD